MRRWPRAHPSARSSISSIGSPAPQAAANAPPSCIDTRPASGPARQGSGTRYVQAPCAAPPSTRVNDEKTSSEILPVPRSPPHSPHLRSRALRETSFPGPPNGSTQSCVDRPDPERARRALHCFTDDRAAPFAARSQLQRSSRTRAPARTADQREVGEIALSTNPSFASPSRRDAALPSRDSRIVMTGNSPANVLPLAQLGDRGGTLSLP